MQVLVEDVLLSLEVGDAGLDGGVLCRFNFVKLFFKAFNLLDVVFTLAGDVRLELLI